MKLVVGADGAGKPLLDVTELSSSSGSTPEFGSGAELVQLAVNPD